MTVVSNFGSKASVFVCERGTGCEEITVHGEKTGSVPLAKKLSFHSTDCNSSGCSTEVGFSEDFTNEFSEEAPSSI